MFDYEDVKSFIEAYSIQYRNSVPFQQRELLQPPENGEEEEEESEEADEIFFNDPVVLPEQLAIVRK